MSRRTGKLCATLLLAMALPLRAGAAAEVSLDAEVDRDEIALDETVTLQISLKGATGRSELEFPGDDMKDFEVVSRGQSMQASLLLNGGSMQMVRSQIYQIVLRPLRTGTLIIPSTSCMVKGRKYTTRLISIRVDQASGGSPGPRRPSARPIPDPLGSLPGSRGRQARDDSVAEGELVAKLKVDKTQVFLGEQVTASALLYSPIGTVRPTGYRPPSLDGFWSEELESPTSMRSWIEDVDGVSYRVVLIKKMALFPTRSGRLTIDPAEIEALIQVESQNPFDIFPETRQVTRRSAPVAIDVRPLPVDGLPPDFDSINVGEWTLESSVSETRVAAGQPVTYRLEANGTGNLRSLVLPRLAPIAGVRMFDSTTTDEVSKQGDRFGGKKVVETILIPDQPGEIVLPSVRWHYFNPAAGRYETALTGEIRLEVGLGSTPGVQAGPLETNTLWAGLRPVHTDGNLSRAGPPPWKAPFFAVLLLGPALAFFGTVLAERLRDRYRSEGGQRRLRRAGRMARRRLASARKLAVSGEAAAFHGEVARALLGYVADKLGQATQGLTRDELARALSRAGCHSPAVIALGEALDACDAGRFGLGASTRSEVLLLGERAIEMLEDAEWKRPGEAA